ncbi:glycosyltransferase family 2 protein [Streptomyces galilaeus]
MLVPQSEPPRLDIVVVNWNTGRCLRRCLDSIAEARSSAYALARVVVVDNASADGSADGLHDLALPLRTIRNAHNRGFAAACNQGAHEGNAPFVLFLNPDTRLPPDTLDRAVGFLAGPHTGSVGICGGQMVKDDGTLQESCARFPRLSMVVARACGLSRVFPRLMPRQWMSVREVDDSRPVDQVIGAFFLVRRPVFEELGGFDERFFLYYEEVDLAYRARQAGFLSYHLADARVWHVGGVSSAQVLGPRLFHSLRGRTEFARLHWRRAQVPALVGVTLAVELPSRAVFALARGRWSELRGVAFAARRYAAYVRSSRPAVPPRAPGSDSSSAAPPAGTPRR